jgi:hypothetical protein
VIDRDELPADPDLDHVPEELRLLAGLDHGQPLVLCEDGVGRAALAIAPGLFGHARRLQEDELH